MYPRKAKNLQIVKNICKMGDLKPYVMATALARMHPTLTEQSLMNMGGELYELRRRHLADFKVTDSSQSLSLRLQLSQSLANAESSWKGNMMEILKQGGVIST